MNDLRPLCSIVYILAHPWLDHTKVNRSVIGCHLQRLVFILERRVAAYIRSEWQFSKEARSEGRLPQCESAPATGAHRKLERGTSVRCSIGLLGYLAFASKDLAAPTFSSREISFHDCPDISTGSGRASVHRNAAAHRDQYLRSTPVPGLTGNSVEAS
jgi:hypothetical protein